MRSYLKLRVPFTNYHVIRWKPKAVTPIHGHKDTECWFRVLKGTLREDVYLDIQSQGYYMIGSNIVDSTWCHINDEKGSHSIRNMTDDYVYSLHHYQTQTIG